MSAQNSATGINSKPVASASLVTAASQTIPFQLPLHPVIGSKLDDGNFRLWKTIVLGFLRAQELEGHVLGTKEAPTEIIKSSDGISEIKNPEYEKWLRTDQFLFAWLLGSMTFSVACQVMSLKSTREVWKAVEGRYGVVNWPKVNLLRTALLSAKKDGTEMIDYLKTMKQLSVSLALAGEPISNNDLISSVLSGLNSAEYMPITYQMEFKKNVSWQEFHAILMAFEDRLHINNKGNGKTRGRGISNYYRSNSSELTCQICGEPGHTGDICDYRYDESYMGNPPPYF